MSSDVSREELTEALLRVTRKVGNRSGLFSQAVAERLGLASIDVETLDLLLTEGRVTVGRLAELTGLTTGSATRMVDRLEQAGFVRRVPDPVDRRRVLVEAVPGLDVKMHALHEPLHDAESAIFDRYDEAELRLFAELLDGLGDVLLEESVRMRAPAGTSEADGSEGHYTAPVGGVTAGRLVFLTGAPRISVRGERGLAELYEATFQGPVPRMRVRGGVVTVAYPRFGWLDWRTQIAGQFVQAAMHWQKDAGEIVLNTAVPWAIELRGGVSSWTGDLRDVRLESFELRGGAGQIELELSKPAGVVPIRVTGGMGQLIVRRPAGTAATLEVRGGVGSVTVDGSDMKGHGRLSIESPGAANAPDRFEIELTGGASRVSIEAL